MFGEGWYTHQILLAQLSELLELLGHQKLSTSNSTPHFPKDYKEKHQCFTHQIVIKHQFITYVYAWWRDGRILQHTHSFNFCKAFLSNQKVDSVKSHSTFS